MSAIPDGLWVNVGSGPTAAAGWTCIDGSWQARLAGTGPLARAAEWLTGTRVGHWPRGIVCRDVRRGLGLAPESAAVIFSSHLIEHLHRDEALALLRDARRALAPGGVCRVITPDLRAIVERYLDAVRRAAAAAADRMQEELLLHPAARPTLGGPLAWYRQRTAFDHHKWVYDGSSLCALFTEAGFARPAVKAHLDSAIPRERLAAVEPAERLENGAGICVEARR